jgi:hypothetical protein
MYEDKRCRVSLEHSRDGEGAVMRRVMKDGEEEEEA